MKKKKIIVIGGAERSGTTLTQTIVSNAFDHCPALPEVHVLCDLIAAYKRAIVNWNKNIIHFQTTHELKLYFTKIISEYLALIYTRYNKSNFFVFKDPNFSKYFLEVSELIPNSSLIVCVRDPRDIAASYLKIGERDKQNKIQSRYALRDISYICRKINQFYKNLFNAGFPSSVTVLKYEEIVVNPDDVIKKLSMTLGLELTIPDYSGMVWLDEDSRHKKTWITDLEGRPPAIDSIGDYQRVLSKEEIEIVENDCRRLMRFFNYSPEKKSNLGKYLNAKTYKKQLVKLKRLTEKL